MSSRAKNFRRRSDTAELNGSGEEKDKGKPTPPPPSTAKKTPSQSKSSAPKRLSFADDEEEADDGPTPPSRPITSSSSSRSLHKHTSSKTRFATPTPSIPSNVQPQAGEYTKERLRELQKNARPLGGGGAASKTQVSDSPAEPVVVLKGLLKPTPPPFPRGDPGKREVGLNDDLDDKADAEDSRHQFTDLGTDRKGKDSPLGDIPDQATIAAIRAKRERLRKSRGAAPDYISLDGGGVLSSRPSENLSSDEEDNEYRGRIALFGDKADDGAKKGVFEEIDDRVATVAEARVVDARFRDMDVDDEEDEEERRWEEEQFRKGLGKRIDDSSAHLVTSSVNTVQPIQPQAPAYSGIAYQPSSVAPYGIGVTRSAEVMSIQQQAEVAIRAMKQNTSKLKETHTRILTSLRTSKENLCEALSNITTLEESLESGDDKFVFMQKLRDFMSVLCDFLQDKAPFIEELEEQMQKLHEERASAIMERRLADIADESIEIEAAVNAAVAILSKGSGAALLAAATNAAQAASAAARRNANLPVQLDEFGRDVNLQKRMDIARRAEVRKRRKARSDSKMLSSSGRDLVYQHIEGESSTDESDSESSAYHSTWEELLQTAGQVFSDAAEEYSKLSSVKERFDGWKKQYLSTYRDAYMSLSVPTIFSPYVRLELLKWDPLYTRTDFNAMDWHNLLLDYGLPGKDQQLDPDDADVDLIPVLVEKVALPILHHEIAHCWDMLSTQRTENAVFATNLVITYIPSSEALRELLVLIRSRLDEAIASLNVPTWSSVIANMVPGAAQLAAYRFGMSVRLLRNICLWKDILALPVLEKLALDELLVKKLLPHVRSVMPNIHDAITRTERIVASISGVWSGPNVTSGHSPKLQPLVDCVGELGRRLEKRQASGVSEEETIGLARRLKKMLVELNEYDRARAILRTFQLKEAL